MAHLLIDGYNLIGTAHRDIERARNELINNLSKYSQIKEHDIAVVFDGWKDGQVLETRIMVSGIMVIYSRLTEKADSVIKRILSEDKKPWIVVSSDREIADFAISRDFVPITSEEFENKLCSMRNTGGERMNEEFYKYDYDEDNTQMLAFRKGNPRKLSKRQRKKLQALKKL